MTATVFEVLTVAPPPGDGTGVPMVQVRGEVDVTNAARLRQSLADLARGSLIVDLSHVGYFDSAGFAALDQLLGHATLAVVAAPGSVVAAAMTLLHIPFHDTADAARSALRRGSGPHAR